MKHCSKCGASIEAEDLKFCPQCGNALQAGEEEPQASAPSPPPAPAPAAAPSGGMEDNIAGLLCYIAGFITGIIFLVIEPYNKRSFVRFHAFQSIFLNVAMIVIAIVLGILAFIFMFISTALGTLLYFLMNIVFLGFFVLWIILMVKAYQNKKLVLPLIGGLAEKQAANQ